MKDKSKGKEFSFCPLQAIRNENLRLFLCMEEECAWWDGKQCAIVSIADNLGDIAVNGMKGEEK